MTLPLHQRSLRSLDELSRREVLALIETARALKRADDAGAPQRLLRGKNLALLADDDGADGALAFERAAAALGAHVAHIRPSHSRLTTGEDVAGTARLLGRLYDGIECEGLPLPLVAEVERHAGVPVFNGLAGRAHATRALGDLLTMSELAGKPPSELNVCVAGDPASEDGQALLQAAALAGVCVHRTAECVRGDGTPVLCDADFLYDEADAACALSFTRAGAAPIGGERERNRRYALQAMLVTTIA
jgi:ornithine carbamoyltransferase